MSASDDAKRTLPPPFPLSHHGDVRLRHSVICSLAVTLVVACAKFEAAEEGTRSADDGGVVGPDGGPPPATEDCVDGRDDNGDGNPDCAEPTCLPHARCVPSPTTLGAWEGYTTLVHDGGPCPPELPTSQDAFRADTDKPTCAVCTCEAKTTCDQQVSVAQSHFDCNQGVLPVDVTPNVCRAVTDPAGGPAVAWLVPATGGTTCAVVTSGETVRPSAKYHTVKVCSGAGRFGIGCPAGEVCAKRTKLCVSRAVEPGTRAECPPAFPIAEIVLPAGGDPDAAFNDDRDCTPCKCGPAVGGSCNRKLALFGQAGCSAQPGPTVTSGSCQQASCTGNGCKSVLLTVTPQPGTCGKGESAPKGGVTLGVAGRQFCCNAP